MHQLIHHDLITVPLGGRQRGIYWLRLYRSGRDHVAVVTEVPGNPSLSATNAIEEIARWIEDEFGVATGVLTIYVIWPRGSLAWGDPNRGMRDRAGVKRVGPGGTGR